MSCDRIQPMLSSYHDDALSTERRAQIRAHIATCTTCQSILDVYECVYTALRGRTIPVPADLRRNTYAAIAETEARLDGRLSICPTPLGILRGAGSTALLSAVLAVLVAAIVRLNSPEPTTIANRQVGYGMPLTQRWQHRLPIAQSIARTTYYSATITQSSDPTLTPLATFRTHSGPTSSTAPPHGTPLNGEP